MKDQLEALVAQMHGSGILYSEAVREFKKRFIMNVLQQNKGNQCKAARQLGMSHRTLARRLALEGLTFSQIVEELKIDLAKRYLQDDNLPISQIAWLLGYSEVSAFTLASTSSS